jgi:lipid-binding SYLF domain-containing protein
MKSKLLLILAVAVCNPLAAKSEELSMNDGVRGRMKDVATDSHLRKMIDVSTEVYRTIAKGPHGEVPQSVKSKARCIAVMPNVITGALVIGGAHGEGIASCRMPDNTWSHPAAISLNQGSIGLQAGAKSTDLVMFFQTQKAESALKRGEFTLGTDLSAVAGKYDASIDSNNAEVIVYSRTNGVFAGVSVSGSKIGKDQEELTQYYGKDSNYLAILEGKETPDSNRYSSKLISLFP